MFRLPVVTTMDVDDDDDDLWGPPFVVEEDSLRKQTLRGCEFWFDCRTDVLEEHFQNERYCELVWKILTEEKKQDELEKDSVSLRNDIVSSGSDNSHDIGSSDSDKTLSAVLPDADTSSAKSDLDEDENTSSISDAQTIEVAEDADTSFSPVFARKIEEAEEHSCSSLVTDAVFDPIKQASENKSSSAISEENIGGSTLSPLPLETREKVGEKENATNGGGDHQQIDSLQDIVTASEPFTTESLLEMCDEPDKGRETSCDERSKRSHSEAVKTAVKDELIATSFPEATLKTESNALMNPRPVLLKKRQNASNSRDNMSSSSIRNTKQKVQGETGEISIDPVKKTAPEIVRGAGAQHADSLPVLVNERSERGGHNVPDVMISTSELKNKTGKELKSIAKALKVTRYYKLKKEDLLQRLTRHLSPS